MRAPSLLLLLEATNYMAMFNDFIADAPNNRATIDRYVKWARTTLKKNDRIVWFLRFARVELAGALRHGDSDGELDRLNKKLATHFTRADLVPLNNLMTNLAHYLSMPIDKITRVIWGKQGPRDLLEEFAGFEQEWRQTADDDAEAEKMYKAGRLIPTDPGDTIIIRCPDGMCWVDLERGACSEEGEAMGHCGNGASRNSNQEQILSLRRPITLNGETYWYPVATFILDSNGMLGEMKGRNNDKPVARYHADIVLLLRSERVEGIKGGGYRPQNNFSLNDLDPDVRDALLQDKPALDGIADLYRREGMSERVLSLLENALSARDLGTPEAHNPEDKTFVMGSWPDFERFLRDIDDDTMLKLLEVATGEADFQQSAQGEPAQLFVATALELPPAWQHKLLQRAGISEARADDTTLQAAANKLVRQGDAWFETFQQMLHSGTTVREQAWARLAQYADAHWSFYSDHVYLDIDLKDLPAIVESDSGVKLLIREQALVDYASTTDDDEDDYSYETHRVQEYGWGGVDWENTNERRREEKLISNRRDGDKWLAGVDRDDAGLADAFIQALGHGVDPGRIADQRQGELRFEGLNRLLTLAGRCQL